MGVDDARLDYDPLIGDVDFQNVIHAGEADHDTALCGQRTATESGSRSARDEGNPVLGTHSNDGLNLLGGSGKDDRARYGAEVCKAIALVSLELARRRNQAAGLAGIVSIDRITKSVEDRLIEHKRS